MSFLVPHIATNTELILAKPRLPIPAFYVTMMTEIAGILVSPIPIPIVNSSITSEYAKKYIELYYELQKATINDIPRLTDPLNFPSKSHDCAFSHGEYAGIPFGLDARQILWEILLNKVAFIIIRDLNFLEKDIPAINSLDSLFLTKYIEKRIKFLYSELFDGTYPGFANGWHKVICEILSTHVYKITSFEKRTLNMEAMYLNAAISHTLLLGIEIDNLLADKISWDISYDFTTSREQDSIQIRSIDINSLIWAIDTLRLNPSFARKTSDYRSLKIFDIFSKFIDLDKISRPFEVVNVGASDASLLYRFFKDAGINLLNIDKNEDYMNSSIYGGVPREEYIVSDICDLEYLRTEIKKKFDLLLLAHPSNIEQIYGALKFAKEFLKKGVCLLLK